MLAYFQVPEAKQFQNLKWIFKKYNKLVEILYKVQDMIYLVGLVTPCLPQEVLLRMLGNTWATTRTNIYWVLFFIWILMHSSLQLHFTDDTTGLQVTSHTKAHPTNKWQCNSLNVRQNLILFSLKKELWYMLRHRLTLKTLY